MPARLSGLVLAPILLLPAGWAGPAFADTVNPLHYEYRHVTFDDIPPSSYEVDADGTLTADVDRSSSFLLIPFDRVVTVDTVTWEWQSDGRPDLQSAAHEESKSGDDALLRIGLLVQGDEPSRIPWFLPAWIRQVREDLEPETTGSMLFLVSGGLHAAGETWVSPYADTIRHLAVAGIPSADGWRRSRATLPEPLDVVGLWLMADGDDTEAGFRTRLRRLELHNVTPPTGRDVDR